MTLLRGTLKSKFLLSFALISALLTWATLLIVRQRVELQVRDEVAQGLRNSVVTFQSLQQQRETTLERSATLVAALPPLKAVMTSQDPATIQDASGTFWDLVGSQLFVLAGRNGKLEAIHTPANGFQRTEAQAALARSLKAGKARDWWFIGGHLFQVFLQPIYIGPPEENAEIGIVGLGYEIDNRVAADVNHIASSQVEFRYQQKVVASTIPDELRRGLTETIEKLESSNGKPVEIQLGKERYLATSVRLSSDTGVVTLTALKSFDEATEFLRSLNRWILAVGFAAVLAGGMLVFLVATTFTQPLGELVEGVQALEQGDFSYPLRIRGRDEVSALTAAFDRMRQRMLETQHRLLDAERLATIGRMANTISHDLRHPLTAILAYAEFLSDGNLTEPQRKDFFQEIRIAVNRMTDEINSLLGFSKEREAIRPVYGDIESVVERAIQAVKILPEFEAISITFSHEGECAGWFDPGKIERVLLNLLFNACEAVPRDTGKVEVRARMIERGLEILVADNGPGIPESIRENLFEPFVSYGKENGIGLGLTVVQKIMHDHGGEVSVESSGPTGTVFKLVCPCRAPAETQVKPELTGKSIV